MSERRDKPTAAFWVAAAAITLVLYALSAIPMTYLHDAGLLPDFMGAVLRRVYWPIGWVLSQLGLIG
jgi:hypothetical protein